MSEDVGIKFPRETGYLDGELTGPETFLQTLRTFCLLWSCSSLLVPERKPQESA